MKVTVAHLLALLFVVVCLAAAGADEAVPSEAPLLIDESSSSCAVLWNDAAARRSPPAVPKARPGSRRAPAPAKRQPRVKTQIDPFILLEPDHRSIA